jgi:uncharacterized protein YkwD
VLAACAVFSALLAVSAAPASAGPYDYLLAPTTTCPYQTDTSKPAGNQVFVMYCMIGYARQRSGVPVLRSSVLNESAARKAADIMFCQQFSHTACGRDFAFHIRAVGYPTNCWGAGENLALGSGSYGSVRSIMSGWLNSDGHRRNMLSTGFRDVGVGLRRGTYRGVPNVQVWVQHLGFRC